MAKNNYGPVMDHVYKSEGGYVDHPRDPGGATNFGITKRTLEAHLGHRVSKDDVRNMSRDVADEIYRARYWNRVKGDHLPYGFDLVAMDGAVNSGPRRGAKWLQIGVGAKVDGVVGGKTIEAARRANVKGIERACDVRMSFLRGLKHWSTFGRGWSRRVASVEATGTHMYLAASEGKSQAREALQERAKSAAQRAKDERRSGATQVGATGAGGATGATVADLPLAAIGALALGVLIVAALLIWRARRKAQYHEDRREAFEQEKEALA